MTKTILLTTAKKATKRGAVTEARETPDERPERSPPPLDRESTHVNLAILEICQAMGKMGKGALERARSYARLVVYLETLRDEVRAAEVAT